MGFEFPPIYNLPPFFTLQPVLETQEKQMKLWTEIIVNYCKHNKMTVMNISENSHLFENKTINRKLNQKGIDIIFDSMVSSGHGEWEDDKKQKIFVYWKSPTEWSGKEKQLFNTGQDIFLKWSNQNGLDGPGSLYTVYELRQGETGEGAEFYELEESIKEW
eukprot:gene5710-9530_t